MESLLKKLLRTVAGVAICIGIWTVQGRISGGGDNASDNIPRQVWGGGAGTVTIEAEANQPAVISASFEGSDDMLEAWQKIPAGKHTFSIDVPANVSGLVELRMDGPAVGATMKLTMVQDGKVLSESFKKLDKPLEPGWGFASGVGVDDYATGKVYEEY
ncbi:MAG TPA: hypothetical protein VFX92_11390 [Candidatus Krumholzibacteria bacterium]|nr:hypothetical protein [Candidatus Krumholzibacteria bacterium]